MKNIRQMLMDGYIIKAYYSTSWGKAYEKDRCALELYLTKIVSSTLKIIIYISTDVPGNGKYVVDDQNSKYKWYVR